MVMVRATCAPTAVRHPAGHTEVISKMDEDRSEADALVQANLWAFERVDGEPAKKTAKRRRKVETATAAPGEMRE